MDLLCFCSVLCLLCFVRVCLFVLCGRLLGGGGGAGLLALVCGVFCEFVTFPLVSWVIVSIPDLCTITYFFYCHVFKICI